MLCSFLLGFQQGFAGKGREVGSLPGFLFVLPLKDTEQILLQGSVKPDVAEKRNRKKGVGGKHMCCLWVQLLKVML